MIFIETPVLTEDVRELLSDEEYRCFQLFLACVPQIGDVIQGTGGLRKVRWASGGKGKRSGVRVISDYLTEQPNGAAAIADDTDLSKGSSRMIGPKTRRRSCETSTKGGNNGKEPVQPSG